MGLFMAFMAPGETWPWGQGRSFSEAGGEWGVTHSSLLGSMTPQRLGITESSQPGQSENNSSTLPWPLTSQLPPSPTGRVRPCPELWTPG